MKRTELKKVEAMIAFMEILATDDVAVFCNGITAREGYMIHDRPRNFYMLASMGHAMMIGLGIAQACSERVVVFDGDGNFFMNPGGPAMIGAEQPPNLIHLVFDNGVYETTGGQVCISQGLDLTAIGRAMRYRSACRVRGRADLETARAAVLAEPGPHLVVIDVVRGAPDRSRVIPMSPQEMGKRFQESMQGAQA